MSNETKVKKPVPRILVEAPAKVEPVKDAGEPIFIETPKLPEPKPKPVEVKAEPPKSKVVMEIPIKTAIKVTEPTKKACICGKCPTFIKGPLADGYFCIKGRSMSPPPQEGCICGRCPIFISDGLKKGRFCE